MFGSFIQLIRLSAKPSTIIYPYPILPLLAFSLSGVFDIFYLFRAITFSSIFYAVVNLWNHVNDIEEDVLCGRRTIITENPKIRNLIIIISPLAYIISFSLILVWSVDKRGIIAFSAAAFATWIYSDRIFIGRKIKRWKDFYVTETLAFVIFFPSFNLALWTIFTHLSLKSIAFSITLTFFMLSGVFLKDIKDITGDKLAGLKTLGVMFSPSSLLKASFLMLVFYYFAIFIFSILKIFPTLSIVSTLFFLGLIYSLKYFLNKNWIISIDSVKPLNLMYYCNLGSLITLIIAGFI